MDGSRFGHYRLIELLGRGGMGEVYRAYDETTDRVVALKVLPEQLAHDEEYKLRFRREAHAAARLADPHIIPIHRYGEIDGRLYLDMRIVAGKDLDRIVLRGPLDPRRAVAIIRQVAMALEAAHAAGLVHRDVKPSNILIDANDFAYLIDFGIARVSQETSLTGVGETPGTYAYMSPERFQTGRCDPRADVYALACVLYECLTGDRPFPSETTEQIMASHLFTPPPRPTATTAGVPPAFDRVIALGMAKDLGQRYQTARQLADAADDALRAGASNPAAHYAPTLTPPPPPPMPPPLPPPPPAPKPPSRNRIVVIATAAVAVVSVIAVVAVAAWLWWPSTGGTVRIGVAFDQPGLGLRDPDGTVSGFDVDVATFIATQLGHAPDGIAWVDAPPAERASLVADGDVDFVVAGFGTNAADSARVDVAGPYLDTGQSLLVSASNVDVYGVDSLARKKLCAVRGSTSSQLIRDLQPTVQLMQYDSYGACVDALRSGEIDVVSTDEVVLAGYAAQSPDQFRLVGGAITQESYGIALRKGDAELKKRINDALSAMEQSGAWAEAFATNFGPAGLSTPSPPQIGS